MTTVGDIIKGKPSEVWSVGPKDKVFHALTLMSKKDIGALLIMDTDGKLLGIFSERDYARKVVLRGKASKETPVEEIMTAAAGMYGVTPKTTVEEAMALITQGKVRHLPVFNRGRVVALVSIGDVLKSMLADKDVQIEHLNNYIAGTYV
jgi:CBS domain-containing protein